MPTPISRVAFSVFGFDIMWYGVLVSAGIAAAAIVSCRRAPKHGLTADKALNFILAVVIAGILGARIYYVIFNWAYYSEDLARVFQFRGGGLAIHGGLIAGALALLIFCRFWKERPLNLLDLYFVVIPLGQAIGRWGNYFNGEAHGGPTGLPWGVVVDGVKVHPTFLYESIWCLLLFVFLVFIDNRRKFEGQSFLLYCMLYSVERFFVEWLRTDSLMLFGIFKQAQVVSVAAIILGGAVYAILYKRSKGPLLDVETEEGAKGDGSSVSRDAGDSGSGGKSSGSAKPGGENQ